MNRICRTTRSSCAPAEPGKDAIPISRPNFLELCARLVVEDEKAFEQLWRRLGLSVDWSLTYTTVGNASRRTSQRAFLRNLARGEAYQAEAPTLWDVDYRTAVAQAELEDRELPGAYHALRFHKADGSGDLLVDTTRPELLAACVAVVAHPDDERYRALFGTEVITALYGTQSPDRGASPCRPGKGNGRGDDLYVRRCHRRRRGGVSCNSRRAPSSVSTAGSSPTRPTRSATPTRTRRSRARRSNKRRRSSWNNCARAASSTGEPRPITHPVKFYERGERPLEIVTSRQWYYRNGGRDPELRAELLRARPRAQLASRSHALAVRDVDRGPQLRLAGESPALLRGAVPGLVPARCEWRGRPRRAAARRPKTACPSIRRPTCPTGSPRRSATNPADSPPIPTSWTHGRRRRSRRRSRPDGSTIPISSSARSRWIFGPRVRRSSVRGCSTRSCARGSNTRVCRGRTRSSTGGCSTPIARRCRSRRATSSRRCRWSRSTAPTRSGTGRATAGPRSTPRSTSA